MMEENLEGPESFDAHSVDVDPKDMLEKTGNLKGYFKTRGDEIVYFMPRSLRYNEPGNFYMAEGPAVGMRIGARLETEVARFTNVHTIYGTEDLIASTQEEFDEAYTKALEFYSSIVNAITERMYMFKFADGEGMTYDTMCNGIQNRKERGIKDEFYVYYAPTTECFRIVKVFPDTAEIVDGKLVGFKIEEFQVTITGNMLSSERKDFNVARFRKKELLEVGPQKGLTNMKGEQLFFISRWHYDQIREVMTDYFIEL